MARTAKRYRDAGKEIRVKGIGSLWVGIYSRLSVDNHDRKSESVENQIEIVSQFIGAHNSSPDREVDFVVYDTYIDRGISGTVFERAGFERLMQDVKERKVTCVIVKDLSRFGRDYLETGNLIENILPCLGCRFIAVTDRFDSMAPDTSQGRLTMNMKNLVNDMYAKDISERVAAVRKMWAERGSFVGGFAPYGYEIVRDRGIRTLRVNEECAEVVRNIYGWYSQGLSCGEIAAGLYQGKTHRISDFKKYGHVYCHDGEVLRQWSEGSVSNLLHNKNYLGNRQGRPAIVRAELFEKVQAMLAGKKSQGKMQDGYKNTENIYRRILYCGNCGKLMKPVSYQSRGMAGKETPSTMESEPAERKFSYVCRNAYRMDGGKCDGKCIGEEWLSAFVGEQIYNVLKRQQVKAEEVIRLAEEEYENAVAGYRAEEKKIRKEREIMKRRTAILYGQFKEGRIAKEEYEVFRQERKEWESYGDKRLKEITEKIGMVRHRMEEERKFLCSFLEADKEQKPNIQLVESLIEKIMVFSDGAIDIEYKFSEGGR